MALKTKVKAGNITNLSDARYCAGMGVDFLGFPVGLNRAEDLKRLAEIRSWVSGPAIVLEYRSTHVDPEFTHLLPSLNVDFIEIDASLLDRFPETEVTLMVHLNAADWPGKENVLLSQRKRIAYILFERSSNEIDNQETLASIAADFSVLMLLQQDDDLEAILSQSPHGIAISGTSEEKPGLKEYSVADVLERLEEA